MGLIDNIKKRFGEYQLKQELPRLHRERVVSNLDDAKTIGILFQFTTMEEMELLKKYVTYLRDLKKKVKALGLFLDKELPAFPYSKLEYDFFNQKNLSWAGKPADHVLYNFIAEPYDVLIDLNMRDQFPLKYIAAVSQAKFKVGRYRDNDQNIHDMLIACPADKSMKFFLRQVDTYLMKINKSAEDQPREAV